MKAFLTKSIHLGINFFGILIFYMLARMSQKFNLKEDLYMSTNQSSARNQKLTRPGVLFDFTHTQTTINDRVKVVYFSEGIESPNNLTDPTLLSIAITDYVNSIVSNINTQRFEVRSKVFYSNIEKAVDWIDRNGGERVLAFINIRTRSQSTLFSDQSTTLVCFKGMRKFVYDANNDQEVYCNDNESDCVSPKS